MKSVVELVDVMKVSDEESILLTGAKSYEQAAEEILAMGPEVSCRYIGRTGAFLWQQKQKRNHQSISDACRSTRLGQVIHFGGGVLCSILSINKNVEKWNGKKSKVCAVLGNAVAGLYVQREVESLRFRRKRQCLNLCRNNECI